MNSKNILIGEIWECTKCDSIDDVVIGDVSLGHLDVESRPYKKNVVLVNVGYHRYVEIKDLTPFLQASLQSTLFMARLLHTKTSSNLVEYPYCMTMDSSPSRKGELFVNEKTLEQYYDGDKDISVQTLRRELGKNRL